MLFYLPAFCRCIHVEMQHKLFAIWLLMTAVNVNRSKMFFQFAFIAINMNK